MCLRRYDFKITNAQKFRSEFPNTKRYCWSLSGDHHLRCGLSTSALVWNQSKIISPLKSNSDAVKSVFYLMKPTLYKTDLSPAEQDKDGGLCFLYFLLYIFFRLRDLCTVASSRLTWSSAFPYDIREMLSGYIRTHIRRIFVFVFFLIFFFIANKNHH